MTLSLTYTNVKGEICRYPGFDEDYSARSNSKHPMIKYQKYSAVIIYIL